jgi:hypothetical protein
VTSFCEQGKEPSGFKRGGEFHDHLSNYLLSKDNAVPKNKLLVTTDLNAQQMKTLNKKYNIVITVL